MFVTHFFNSQSKSNSSSGFLKPFGPLQRKLNFFNFLKLSKKTKFTTEFGRKLSFFRSCRPAQIGYTRIRRQFLMRRRARKRRLLKRFEFKNSSKRCLYYIIVKRCPRNLFVCIHDGTKRKLLKYFSFGTLKSKRSKRASVYSAAEVGTMAIKYIIELAEKKLSKNYYFIFVLKSPPSKEIRELFSVFSSFAPWLPQKTLAFFTSFKSQHGDPLRRKKRRRLLYFLFLLRFFPYMGGNGF